MAMASARLRTPSQRSSMLKLSPPRMMCRWLSIKPGNTRRPLRSITRVSRPANGTMSRSCPTRTKRPSLMATALAVGLVRSKVANSPRCRIRSGASVLLMKILRDHSIGKTEQASRPVRGERPVWNDVLRQPCRWKAMQHRVCVLHSAAMGLNDVHDGIVGIAKRPVALQLEHHSERGDRLRTGLNGALHGVLMGKLAFLPLVYLLVLSD